MEHLEPLTMSASKDSLQTHLRLDEETYNRMSKETEPVYRWLTAEKRHLKKNCTRKPPYDWSDVTEKSKDEAMERIARSGDGFTSQYWELGVATKDCPNWVARWFLYHKFRYRDGRNRNNTGKSEKSKHSSHRGSSKQVDQFATSHQDYQNQEEPYYPVGSMGSSSMGSGSNVPSYQYAYPDANNHEYTGYSDNSKQDQNDEQAPNTYYDPVRDT